MQKTINFFIFFLKTKSHKLKAEILSPKKDFCTDNAAMIGAYALLAGKIEDWRNVKSNPELYFA